MVANSARGIPCGFWNTAFAWLYIRSWDQRLSFAFHDGAIRGHHLSGCWNYNRVDGGGSGGYTVTMKRFILFTGGLLFGFGLAFGGMSKPEIVLSFLQLKDLGLLLLLGSSAFVTGLTINLAPKMMKRPTLGEEFRKRTRILNRNTIIGAALFGVGWGISGQCPGSALASLGVGNIAILPGLATMFLGAYVMGRFVA